MRKHTANMPPLHLVYIITLLLAPTTLSFAELAGENLCHKRETYTVTMRVLVKEPMQVKTYTWCLKVPPRCTKYKVEMRDKYRTQTEIKERVVDVCCAGYAPDRTESHCLPVCSGCLHGICASPDTCTCEAGYTGDNCHIECEEGLWGPECKQECLCKNGADCHHVTGDCKCSEGWRGVICDVPCPKGTYGHACLEECNCSEADTNATCHHITGECLVPQTTDVTFPPTIATPHVADSEEQSTTVIWTLFTNGELSTVSPAQTDITPLPNTVFYIDKFTTVIEDRTFSLKTTPTTTTIAVTKPSDIAVSTREEKETTMQNELINNSATQSEVTVTNEPKDSDADESDELNSLHDPITTKKEESEEDSSTEPQNIQVPPRGIIVVSDGLMSDRINKEEGANEKKDSRNDLWDLVSSVSVAGGVALALILMAAVMLLVSHLRNKRKVAISGNVTSSTDQQSSASRPQMYNYTEDVSTLPLRPLFPDVAYQSSNVGSTPDGLQLRFGDVASTCNNIGQPYNDMRAYLELQYDIPPSSISSCKTSSFQPGLEPEHLYDEIPCWRSNTTTSTNTDTDTSRC